jgi:GDP-mannose 6-dehydrogenase
MNISVFGLGYVGSVTSACLAKNGHFVIGIDIKREKVAAINAGKSPVFEKGLDDLISEVVADGKLKATISADEAIKKTDISLICVGTPSNLDGSINLEHLKRVCSDIGRALKTKSKFHVVVIRSTVLPGTTEGVLLPILESESKKKNSTDFGVCVNPEFMREGQARYDFYNPDRIVIGATDKNSSDLVEKIYMGINTPVVQVDIKTAEIIKYVDNVFHGMKVAFANEIGTVCRKLGIDGREVMRIFCIDQKLNLSPYYFMPGFAFGGSCIPKDLRAILHKTKELEIDSPLIGSILDSNQRHIDRAVELIMEQDKRKIGVFGLTFKSGTGDTRETPTVPMITKLLEKGYLKLFEKGYDIRIYDPNANATEIEEMLPHIAPLLNASFEMVVKASEVLVVTKNEEMFKQIPAHLNNDQIVIDLAGAINPQDMKTGKYIGICW